MARGMVSGLLKRSTGTGNADSAKLIGGACDGGGSVLGATMGGVAKLSQYSIGCMFLKSSGDTCMFTGGVGRSTFR